jgi:hypothetical protein
MIKDSLPKEKINMGNKPKEILQFEKKNKNKSKVKLRDGATGN